MQSVESDISDRLRGLLADLRGPRAAALAPGDDFVALLGMDSIEVVNFVLALEEAFGLEFGDAPEALASLEALARFVEIRAAPR